MYAANGVAAFFVYSVGPATPLIAGDLEVSTQSAALHGTAMAAALLMAGGIAAPVIGRWGRRGALARAMLAMGTGVILVLVAPILLVSLLGAFIAGCAGAIAAIVANATLADTHPQTAPTVLSEANATAAWVGLFAPLLMGVFLAVGLGWRVGLALAVPMCLAMAWSLGRRAGSPGDFDVSSGREEVALASHDQPEVTPGVEPIGPVVVPARGSSATASGTSGSAGQRRPIPRAVWMVMVAVAAAAGAEFAVNYWGSTLLLANTAASAGAVTAAMSAPVAGVAVGRTIGARLALRLPAHRLMVGGWVVALVGFVGFWQVGTLPLAVAGLFLTGLGLSMIFPLLLDRAVLLMPDRSDRAMALAMPSVGLAIGVAPYGLGALAGEVGVVSAFLVVPLSMSAGLGAVLVTRPGPTG
jgi:predicted MFS family arabinose efflux permease